MRSLGSIDHFIVGAVGEPGRRTFLVEIAYGTDREWFLIEKEQAAALAERGLALLRDLDITITNPVPALGNVGQPTFRVAEIDIGTGTGTSTIVIVLSPQDETTESVSFTVDVQTFKAMARQTLQIVVSGRPKCLFCGLPVDPDGHTCPSVNGDRRGE